MVGTIVYQLTRNLSMEEIKASGFDSYFVDHTTGIYPNSAGGIPFTASALQVKGDILTDLHEDLAADEMSGFGLHRLLLIASCCHIISLENFIISNKYQCVFVV